MQYVFIVQSLNAVQLVDIEPSPVSAMRMTLSEVYCGIQQYRLCVCLCMCLVIWGSLVCMQIGVAGLLTDV